MISTGSPSGWSELNRFFLLHFLSKSVLQNVKKPGFKKRIFNMNSSGSLFHAEKNKINKDKEMKVELTNKVSVINPTEEISRSLQQKIDHP